MPLLASPLLADFVSWWDGLERDVVHFVTCKLYHPWLDPIFLGVQSQTLASVLMGFRIAEDERVSLPVLVIPAATLACGTLTAVCGVAASARALSVRPIEALR